LEIDLPSAIPALGTQICTGPFCATAFATTACVASGSVTSSASGSALQLGAASSSTSIRRPVMVTAAPWAAKACAMASPIPVPPPVMNACLP